MYTTRDMSPKAEADSDESQEPDAFIHGGPDLDQPDEPQNPDAHIVGHDLSDEANPIAK